VLLQAVGQAALDLLQLGIDGCIEVAALGLKDYRADWARGVGDHLHFGRGAVLAQAFGEQRNVRGVDPDARDFLPAQFFESAKDQAMEGFGIDGEFATQDAAGNGEGKLYQVGFGLGAQAGAQAADFLDGTRQAVDDGLYFGRGTLASRGFSLTQSGGVSFARALFGLLLQLRDALP
jgi:hypothetical protein